MTREYTLPEMEAGEDNWDWCRRAVASVPDDVFAEIMRKAVRRSKWSRKRHQELWVHVENVTAHGKGVSHAFVERWESEQQETASS